MAKFRAGFIVAFAVILFASTASAGLITGVSSANNAIATVTGISSAAYTHVASGVGTGGVTIDLDVFQMHMPVRLDFSYAARGADPVATDYSVTLRLRNMIAGASGLTLNGFDLTNTGVVTPDVLSAGLRGSVAITSDKFLVQYSGTLNITNGFRWGALLGTGPTLAPGDTAVNTFVYRVTWGGSGAGTSSLNFVANPEPTTILLGSLAMVPAWVIARRRRSSGVSVEDASLDA
jgi:hypothetical protein